MKIKIKKMKKTVRIQKIQKEKIMKIHAIRINKMFFTSMLILSLGYTTTLTFNSNVKVDNLTIETGDKVVVATNKTLTVLGAVNVNGTGELEIATGATVDVTGAVTIVGALDMDGTARLMLGGDLTLTGATLEDADGNGIYLDGGGTQTVSGTITGIGKFDNLICSGGATILDLTVAIEDSLVTGGQNFTISAGKTLTMNAGSVTRVSGGTWDLSALGATLTLDATSKFLYDTAANATLTGPGVTYGIIEHAGGELTQTGALNVAGIFTNTSGNFVASQNITASGIVWTADAVTGTPTQAWDIGTDGVTINGGTFLATTGAFTVEGDWTNAGTFTASTSTVNFDKGAAQSITSGGDGFNSVTVSNNSTVNLQDPFEFSVGTLTIDAGATFATLGQTFDDNNATITNNGTFEIHGDESFTTGVLSIPGNTKIVDPAGCTLTVTIGGLVNVNFESGSTIILGEDMPYITGNIDIAVGTTLDMAGKNLTVADGMTVTNLGTWAAPVTPSTFTCADNATLAGVAMNFWNFTATTASAVITFKGGITYTVENDLTLTGGDGTEMTLQSDNDGVTTAIISNTGLSLAGTQSVNFIKVGSVEATGANKITATNSWDIHGSLLHWLFDAMLYSFTTTGDWDEVSYLVKRRPPRSNDNIEVLTGQTLTLDGDRTINDVTIIGTGIIDVATDAFTIDGDLVVAGTITTSTGSVDVDGEINAATGNITFTHDDGVLIADSTILSLGTLTNTHGTVKYNAPLAQAILAGTYKHIQVSDINAIKTLGGVVTLNGGLTVDTGVTIAMGANNLEVTEVADINGTVTITTAILDANGEFDATGGTITFTGAGDLQLGGAVTHLGDISTGAGTVTYNGTAQNIFADIYFNLTAPGTGTVTKTLAGAVTVNGVLTIGSNITVAMATNNLTVVGLADIDGIVTITTATLDADGEFDAENGTITFTSTGNLELGGTVTHLGTLSDDAGTVNYNMAGSQNIFADTYFNLTTEGAATKTLAGAVILNGALLIDAATTVAMGGNDLSVTGGANIGGILNVVNNTLTVTGASVVTGTININTGTVDADGTFNATGGTIDFTGAGELQLGDAVTHLGTLSDDAGTVTYDGGAQAVFLDDYWDLTAGGTATKTLGGAVTVNNNLSISNGVTFDVNVANHAVIIKQNFTCVGTGSFTSRSGTVTFSGTVNQALTSAGSTFNNIVFANTGGVDKVLAIIDNLDIDGDLTVTSGAFDITGAIDVALSGNLSIANGADWTKGDGTLTFNGTTQTFADGNATPKNLGNISINQ